MYSAKHADRKSEALKYINKALKIEPDNVDVLIQKVQIDSKSDIDLLKKVEKILENGKKYLVEKKIYCNENIGDFWLILEARPYMRGLYFYLDMLIALGMYKKAIEIAEKMLILCKNDNLGIRYRLMTLYIYFEDVEKAEDFYRKNSEYNEIQILLPLSILYYKQGNFTKSKQILTKLAKNSKDTKKFLKAISKGKLTIDTFKGVPSMYRPGTIDEYYVAFYEGMFLYANLNPYFEWAYDELNKKS